MPLPDRAQSKLKDLLLELFTASLLLSIAIITLTPLGLKMLPWINSLAGPELAIKQDSFYSRIAGIVSVISLIGRCIIEVLVRFRLLGAERAINGLKSRIDRAGKWIQEKGMFPISRRVWYHFALFIPLIIIIPIGNLKPSFSLLPIGYALFAFALIGIYRRKSADDLKHLSWKLPLFFAPLCIMALLLSDLLHPAPKWLPPRGLAELVIGYTFISLLFFIFSLIYGYIFVLFVHGFTWVLQKTKCLRD